MHRNMIAIGGSAGSFAALRAIVAALPGDFTGNVFITLHIGRGPSQLPAVLARAAGLPVSNPADREPIQPGHVYVAPPDRHLRIEGDLLRLSRGPREHFTRPAIDPLFRSVADAYAERAVGVILSGRGSDGAAGVEAIKRAGGTAVVLNPRAAAAPEMPEAAVEIVEPDYLVAEDEIPGLLIRLSQETVSTKDMRPSGEPQEATEVPERPVALTCPECGGALRQLGNSPALQYRCHIGHRFAAAEILPAQLEKLEEAIGVAERVLNERVELTRRMVEHAETAGRTHSLHYWQALQAEAEKQIETIRRVLASPEGNGQAHGELAGAAK